MRKQVPPDKTNSVLEFATKRPNERLESICNGLSVCTESISGHPAYRLFKGPRLWTIRICSPVWHDGRRSATEDTGSSYQRANP